eukprot:s3022_g4.t2
MKPKMVKEYLDRYIIEQDDAKRVLSVALCDHYNWARRCLDDPSLRAKNYTKPNILISGPTGSGKTYLVRTMAKMLGVPFVKADATKFSETGIVGEDAEDVVRQLADAAGGSSAVAGYGIVHLDLLGVLGGSEEMLTWAKRKVLGSFSLNFTIVIRKPQTWMSQPHQNLESRYIDEVDKICSASGGMGGRGGWSGSQVQSNFLKIMEDTEVSAKNSMQASLSSMFGGGQDESISTKFVLFIFSGAFTGMNDIIKNRVGTKAMGFLADDDPASNQKVNTEEQQSYLHLAETNDFIEAGLEPEFVGRIPVRVAIRALDSNDLYKILTEAEDSILLQFQNDFSGYGIQLKAEEAALRRVAELAVEEKTGARALVTILEKVLRNFKFELPSTSCTELLLTRDMVEDPTRRLAWQGSRTTQRSWPVPNQGALQDLLCSPALARGDVNRWLVKVEERSKIHIDMPDEVRDRVVAECAKRRQSAERVLDSMLRDTGVISGFESIREATKGSVELFCISEAMLDQTLGNEKEACPQSSQKPPMLMASKNYGKDA